MNKCERFERIETSRCLVKYKIEDCLVVGVIQFVQVEGIAFRGDQIVAGERTHPCCKGVTDEGKDTYKHK